MDDSLQYRGFVIQASPEKLVDGTWTLRYFVQKHRSGSVVDRLFEGETYFKTRAEAIEACFHAGQQVIDGTVPGCTVEDL